MIGVHERIPVCIKSECGIKCKQRGNVEAGLASLWNVLVRTCQSLIESLLTSAHTHVEWSGVCIPDTGCVKRIESLNRIEFLWNY